MRQRACWQSVFPPVLLSTMFSKWFLVNARKGATLSCPSSSVIMRGLFSDSNFVVRRLLTPEEIREEICERAVMVGWRLGALDHVSYFAADPTGFYVGELGGKTICCTSCIKYKPSFSVVGSHIVDKPYRGGGYGMRIFNQAIESSDLFGTFAGDAEEYLVSMYTELGGKPYWDAFLYHLNASSAVKALDNFKPPNSIRIQPPSIDFFPAILQYDSIVNGFSRQAFLKEWIFAPNCHTSVALDSNGEVVGYSVVRSTLRKEEGWKIGPCYADNSLIARSLYQDMLIKVASSDPHAVIDITIPSGQHFVKETVGIVKQLQGKLVSQSVRIYFGGTPEISFKNIFATTNSQLG